MPKRIGTIASLGRGDVLLRPAENRQYLFEKQTTAWTFNVDTLAPIISELAPADGSTVEEGQPTIGAAFADPLPPGATDPSGVAPLSIVVILDGVDVSELAGRSETGFSYVPSEGLTAGPRAVSVSLADNAGNPATAAWSFTVTDVEAPVISLLYPYGGALIVNPKPEMLATFSDSGTAVNPATAQILLDGVDVTTDATVTAEGFAFTPLTDLALGAHTMEVQVADTMGNLATASASFEVVAPVLAYWEEKALSVSVHGEIPPGSDVAEIQALVTAVDFGTPEGIEVTTTTDLAAGSFSVLFRKIGLCTTFTAAFRFADGAQVLGLPTLKEFTFDDLGGGGDPTGKPPAPPTIVGIEVVDNLTGDEKDDTLTPKMRFTNEKTVSVRAEVHPAAGTSIQSVTITASGPSAVSQTGQGGGGFFTVELGELAEGEYRLSASAVAVKDTLTSSATLEEGKELALTADFTKPEVVYSFPPRRSCKDDKDIIFLNGNSAADNATFRQYNNNFYAPSELVSHSTVVDALSGLSKKDEYKPKVMVDGPGASWRELTATVTPATEQEPAKIDVAAVPNDLPESVTMNGIAIAAYNGRATYHVKLTDRCGNELNTMELSEDDAEEASLLERNAFRMWVDRTPPDAENGQNDWDQYKVVPIGKTDSIFNGPKAYYAVSSFDAAEGWQDSESLSTWLVKAYRTPAMLPKAEEFEIASQEFSPWLLKNPVSMPKPGPSAVPGKVKVRMRDLAGNISDWIELTGWELPEFDRAEGWADPKPQKLENGRTFTPAIMTIPPSFEDPPRAQDFSMHHIDVDELDDENEDGYVDVLNEPGATLQEPSDPAVGVAPTQYVETDQHNVPYGYTDLYNVWSYNPSEGFLSGTIPGTSESIGGALTRWYPDQPWDFRKGDAGWTRAVNRYIHTGYHWTNAVKMRPDVVATGTVVTLRVSGGFVDPANPAASGLIQTVAVGGSQATVLALPDPTKWDYVKFNGGALNGDPNETDPEIRAQKITILKDEQGNLRQRLLWGEKDDGNGTVVQTLEMDVEIGSAVDCGLFDVCVAIGGITHTMQQSLAVIGMTFADGYSIGSLKHVKIFGYMVGSTPRYMGYANRVDSQHPVHLMVKMNNLGRNLIQAKKVQLLEISTGKVFQSLEESIKQDPEYIALVKILHNLWASFPVLYRGMVYPVEPTIGSVYPWMLSVIGIPPEDAHLYWQSPGITETGPKKYALRYVEAKCDAIFDVRLEVANVVADTNRSGGEPKDDDNISEKAMPIDYLKPLGALVLSNSNFDGQLPNDSQDYTDGQVNGPDDLADLVMLNVHKLGLPLDEIPNELSVKLELVNPDFDFTGLSAVQKVHVFDGYMSTSALMLGGSKPASVVYKKTPGAGEKSIDVLAGDGNLKLGIEGVEYGTEVIIRLTVSFENVTLLVDNQRILVAPFLVTSNVGALRRAFLPRSSDVNSPDGQAINTFNSEARMLLGGIPVTDVTLEQFPDDGWLQDCMEIGRSRVAAAQPTGYREMNVILDVNRSRSLGRLPSTLHAAPFNLKNLGFVRAIGEAPSWDADRFNAGGNIECSPPNDSWPAGRIIVGGEGAQGGIVAPSIHADLRAFFLRQKVQVSDSSGLLAINTGWLAVGHVDEVVSFAKVNGQDSMLVAAPQRAMALWTQAGGPWAIYASMPIPDFLVNYTNTTLAEVTANVPLSIRQMKVGQYNEWLWNTYLQPVVAQLPPAVGLKAQNVIQVPVVFLPNPDPIGGKGRAAAYLFGNPVNLLVRWDGGFIVPDVPDSADFPNNPCKPEIRAVLGNIDIGSFVDSSVMGGFGGDVHCATNAVRIGPRQPEWRK